MHQVHFVFKLTACIAFCLLAGQLVHGQSMTVDLTPSDYNGNVNISCFGLSDGSIFTTVTGGTPPYFYRWSNSETTTNITGLPSGYYSVTVNDNGSLQTTAQITLVQPPEMKLTSYVHQYENGKNISCFDCENGIILLEVSGGVEPYIYLWNDNYDDQDRWGLAATDYSVTITDQNECRLSSENFSLSSPERRDWTMSGNEGTDPETDYFGTSDETDMIIKTDAEERIRVKSDGAVIIPGLIENEPGVVMVDEEGTLYNSNNTNFSLAPGPWMTGGNQIPVNGSHVIGTNNEFDLIFRTNATNRMWLTSGGKVGIGIQPASNGDPDYKLYVDGSIAARELKIMMGSFPDFVFDSTYQLMPIQSLTNYIETNKHLPGVPSGKEISDSQGIETGSFQQLLLQKIEELTLYLIQQQEQIDHLKRQLESNTR